MSGILDVRSLSMNFGGLAALKQVNFSIQEGQIVGLPSRANHARAFFVVWCKYPRLGLMQRTADHDRSNYLKASADSIKTFTSFCIFFHEV